jgi:arsenate reductase
VDDLDKDFIDNLDFVITLCAEEVCPVFDNPCKKLHWMNIDPDNKDFNDSQLKSSFKSTRNNIYNLLKKFFTEIL